jgi:hypothetical protein
LRVLFQLAALIHSRTTVMGIVITSIPTDLHGTMVRELSRILKSRISTLTTVDAPTSGDVMKEADLEAELVHETA